MNFLFFIGLLLGLSGFLISGCSPNKKTKETVLQEEPQKTQWHIVEHSEESPVNIKDFQVFIKEFKMALEEKNWPRVHAMWRDHGRAKKTSNPLDQHPDVEWSAESYEIVLNSLGHCNASFGDCTYEKSDLCYRSIYIREQNRWVYAYMHECGD